MVPVSPDPAALYARRDKSTGALQTLRAHSSAVAALARSFASAFGGGDEAFAAGLVHDLGKATADFQDYLLRGGPRTGETHHAPLGAAVAFRRQWLGATFAAAGHHAGLHECHRLQELVDGVDAGRLSAAIAAFTCDVALVPEVALAPSFVTDELTSDVYARMIASCVVDADRLDAAGDTRMPVRLQDVVGGMLDRVLAERDSKPRDGELNGHRHEVFDQCIRAAEEPQGFFSLTVPTGGGKTLASMAFALAHAKRWGLGRVIVVIPYLSIIEQNAAEYHRVLDPTGSGLVLEHHSAVEQASHERGHDDGSEDVSAENWDSPVVVTTSVQFIESLFAASPSRIRKLHNIAGSVVIADEVQTLPIPLIAPILSMFRELKEHYGVTFVMMTATQPTFAHRPRRLEVGFRPGEVREVVDNPPKLFRALRRVDYVHEREPIPLEALGQRLAEADQVLCIVNTKKQAAELWEDVRLAMPEHERDSVLHLSSSLCAAHRLAVLGARVDPANGTVHQRLRDGQPCRLVATQVVEAGVDVDFPLLYRALGPLDSIAQAAGRCNREGRPTPGRVVVFTPEDNRLPGGGYRQATTKASIRLEAFGADCLHDPRTFAAYFNELFQDANTDKEGIQEHRAYLRFRTVAEKARVIDDGGQPVVVPYGDARCKVAAIRGTHHRAFGREDLRSLQRQMVNVHRHDFMLLHGYGVLCPLLDGLDLWVLEGECYHDHLGLLIQQRPLEELCGV